MTPFRLWVHNLWIENCEEHNIFGEKRLSSQEYFTRYKYWLKREYRHRQKVSARQLMARAKVDEQMKKCYNYKNSNNES